MSEAPLPCQTPLCPWNGRTAIPIYCWRHKVSRDPKTMKTTLRARRLAPAQLGFLIDELRSAGVTTYANLAATLNRQGIRPRRGRWSAHELRLLMRRYRRADPAAVDHGGTSLYRRRADEARRVIRRLKRRGLGTQVLIARALNARGLTTPWGVPGQRAASRGCWQMGCHTDDRVRPRLGFIRFQRCSGTKIIERRSCSIPKDEPPRFVFAGEFPRLRHFS